MMETDSPHTSEPVDRSIIIGCGECCGRSRQTREGQRGGLTVLEAGRTGPKEETQRVRKCSHEEGWRKSQRWGGGREEPEGLPGGGSSVKRGER